MILSTWYLWIIVPFMYIWLTLILRVLFYWKKEILNISLKEAVYIFILFYLILFFSNYFLESLILPMFSWGWERFYKYLLDQDLWWRYLFGFIFSFILIPIIGENLKKYIYWKYQIPYNQSSWLNLFIYFIAYLILLFFTFYSGLLSYQYFIIE